MQYKEDDFFKILYLYVSDNNRGFIAARIFYTSHSHYGKIKIAGGVNMEILMERRNVGTLHSGTIKTSKTLPGRWDFFDLETDRFG